MELDLSDLDCVVDIKAGTDALREVEMEPQDAAVPVDPPPDEAGDRSERPSEDEPPDRDGIGDEDELDEFETTLDLHDDEPDDHDEPEALSRRGRMRWPDRRRSPRRR